MKKKYFYMYISIIIILLLYIIGIRTKLHNVENSNNNEEIIIMNDHLLSMNLLTELEDDKILEDDSYIKIQNIIDALEVADITYTYIFRSDSIFIGTFYQSYISLLKQYNIELIKTGTIKDKNRFNDIINDLNIIKKWLEDRYHNDNFTPYSFRELKEQFYSKLKYYKFD